MFYFFVQNIEKTSLFFLTVSIKNAFKNLLMKKQEREKHVQKGWPDAENVTVERETDLELGLVIAG